MCLDSLNWTLWVRFHGRYWYQSFIDGSNIWGVDRTDPRGPEMDHPPFGRSYLVVESSCYMALTIVTCKRNTSAAAKYELYILLPAEQRCRKNALQRCKLTLLSASIYVYIYIYILLVHREPVQYFNKLFNMNWHISLCFVSQIMDMRLFKTIVRST